MNSKAKLMTTRIASVVGANLLDQHSAERNQDAIAYVGNLGPQNVDEKLLSDTFSAFGLKTMRDPESGNSRGFGFISYDSFEASDAAIEECLHCHLHMFELFAMSGQFLCNYQITVSYAYKTRKGSPMSPQQGFGCKQPKFPEEQAPYFVCGRTSNTPSGPQADGAMGALVPPRPFPNGTVPPGPMPVVCPPLPQCTLPNSAACRTSTLAGLTTASYWTTNSTSIMPPPMRFRPPPSNMPPPPPPMAVSALSSPSPPMGMRAPHVWAPAQTPLQQMGGRILCRKCQCHPLPHLHLQVEDP